MDDVDSQHVTMREILNVFSYEMTRLDKDIWPADNATVPRSLILEHFERLKHELFKVARRPRALNNGDSRQGGTGALQPEPSEWDSTAQVEFERNRTRYQEKMRAHRSSPMGLGRGEAPSANPNRHGGSGDRDA